jgi:hypothetical protein
MVFVKSFKGYEDKIQDMDTRVNAWIHANIKSIQQIVDVKVTMSHETNARSASGDLIYCVLYDAAQPLPE